MDGRALSGYAARGGVRSSTECSRPRGDRQQQHGRSGGKMESTCNHVWHESVYLQTVFRDGRSPLCFYRRTGHKDHLPSLRFASFQMTGVSRAPLSPPLARPPMVQLTGKPQPSQAAAARGTLGATLAALGSIEDMGGCLPEHFMEYTLCHPRPLSTIPIHFLLSSFALC